MKKNIFRDPDGEKNVIDNVDWLRSIIVDQFEITPNDIPEEGNW